MIAPAQKLPHNNKHNQPQTTTTPVKPCLFWGTQKSVRVSRAVGGLGCLGLHPRRTRTEDGSTRQNLNRGRLRGSPQKQRLPKTNYSFSFFFCKFVFCFFWFFPFPSCFVSCALCSSFLRNSDFFLEMFTPEEPTAPRPLCTTAKPPSPPPKKENYGGLFF